MNHPKRGHWIKLVIGLTVLTVALTLLTTKQELRAQQGEALSSSSPDKRAINMPVKSAVSHVDDVSQVSAANFSSEAKSVVLAPDPFDKISPLDNSTCVPNNPALSWESANNAVSYEYCIDTSDNDSCDMTGGWQNIGNSTSVQVTGLNALSTYYWQVRALDNVSAITEADGGTWWQLTTVGSPGPFAKSSPANGATNQSTSLALTWNSSACATSYRYCFDTVNNNSCDGSWTNVGLNTHVNLSNLSQNTTYYWQIEATNNIGTTFADNNQWRRFTTGQTSGGATATPIYVDRFEPNNNIQSATSISTGAATTCALTLWPSGDIDFFSFVGKPGLAYEALTSDLEGSLDTVLTIYDTQGNVLASNDDYEFGSLASRVAFSASVDGFYFAKIVNKSPADPANQTYCFEVNEIQGTATPTSAPTTTRVPGADGCEYNGDFDSACLLGSGETLDMNFVPLWGEGPDNDFYRIWVKPGLLYTCETSNLSSVNDTNMILYDQNRNGLGGNDDKAPGDLGSRVSWFSTYTGWLYILVGPYPAPEYSVSYLYTYSVSCSETVATPTATPTSTSPPSSGVIIRPPTATPVVINTPTPIATLDPGLVTVVPATPTPTPNIQIVPLPTNTPVVEAGGNVNVELTVYFDANENFMAELTEGVEDVAVAIYDNATNELLAFGYTNEAGTIRFSSLTSVSQVRVSIPFLQYSQTIVNDSSTLIRIAPFTRPVPPS